MKIRKILLILMIIFCVSGCTNLDSLSYDDFINSLSTKPKHANTYKRGYQYYIPKGLQLSDAGDNYAVLSSSSNNYYLYVDLVSYNEEKTFVYEKNENAVYSTRISYDGKEGYAEINLWENNQYLIEIMYNYAKIEVMVEESLIKQALANSIAILNSVKYNDLIIENLLKDDNLTYTEEVFDMFEETEKEEDSLEFVEEDNNIKDEEEVKDTDFIN